MEKAKQFLPHLVAWLVIAIQFFAIQMIVTIPEQIAGPYWPVWLGTLLILYKTPVENVRVWKKGLFLSMMIGAMVLFEILVSRWFDHVPSLHELEQSPEFFLVIAGCPYGAMFCVACYVRVKFIDWLSKK